MPPATRSRSQHKRSESMNGHDSSTLFLNNLVSLPINISDYDAMNFSPHHTSGSTTQENASREHSVARSDTASDTISKQKWSTGFSDFADDLWSRMTAGMKQKLRDACVEVLKRTDGHSHEERMYWQYDDDARFLD